jgi:two-component system, LuxR family, sensor kinase FixL
LPLHSPEGLEGCMVLLCDMTERRQLERDVLEISHNEKTRIGRDLHDGVCQVLTGLRFLCNVLVGKLTAKGMAESTEVAEIQKLVSQALLESDTVAKGLFPATLEMDGLVAALEELTSKTAKLYHIACRFLCGNLVFVSSHTVSIHIYRIVQEALTNAIKHGRAKNIGVWLTSDGDYFTLIVKDDGPGSSEVSRRHGMGWRIMVYRARAIGASLGLEHLPGGGTVLTCEFSDRSEHAAPKQAAL